MNLPIEASCSSHGDMFYLHHSLLPRMRHEQAVTYLSQSVDNFPLQEGSLAVLLREPEWYYRQNHVE